MIPHELYCEVKSMTLRLASLVSACLFATIPSAMAGPDETQLQRRVFEMPWTGTAALALDLFKQAETRDIKDPSTWFKLGMALYDGRSYRSSIACFRRITAAGRRCCVLLRFSAYVWQGHLFDLLGRRNDALENYKLALSLERKNRGMSMRHDQYGWVVDRAWVEARLQTPFSR